MPRNGSGTYSLPVGNPVVTSTVISSTWANSTLTDIATALTASIAKDGQTTITANIPMAGYKFTGLGAGSAAGDSARIGNLQNSTGQTLGGVAGADTITATASPTLTAYAGGQTFRFVAAGTNTGAVTLNIDSLGAKAVTKFGTTALAASDILSGQEVVVTYDGTQFQLCAPARVVGYQMSTAKLLGRTTASTGAVEELSVGSNMSLTGGVLSGTVYDSAATASNYTIAASRAGNAETIALKTKAGTDPSASDPITIAFRNVTAGTGDYTTVSITAATSITISSGSTLGMANSIAARLWLVGFNDGGTFRLGIINGSVSEDQFYSSTAEGGAGAADSAGVIYTGTAVTTKAIRILGYLDYTLATVGTWGTAPTKIQIVPGSTWLPAGTSITLATEQATTSGTAITFSGIPTGVRRITINFVGVSTGGTSNYLIQLGDGGGIENTGYLSSAGVNATYAASTAGFIVTASSAAAGAWHGSYVLTLENATSNQWCGQGTLYRTSDNSTHNSSGSKPLSAPLDRVSITTVSSDTFDAGAINIAYE